MKCFDIKTVNDEAIVVEVWAVCAGFAAAVSLLTGMIQSSLKGTVLWATVCSAPPQKKQMLAKNEKTASSVVLRHILQLIPTSSLVLGVSE